MTSARRSQIAPCVGNLEDLVVSAFVDDVAIFARVRRGRLGPS
jgi:hypothetical protein